MEIVLLFAGLCLMAIGALVVLSEARTRRGAVEVPARLIGFSTASGGASGGPFFHAVAQFDGLDGQTRYLESSVGSSSPLGAVGDGLSVFVQPGDPDKAAIKSPLPYVLGGVVALMGLGSCIAFFAVFRVTTFSIAGAAAVVGWGAWKLHGSLRDKAISPQAWRDYKRRLLGARLFTEATRGSIRWADPAALQGALRSQQKTNRFAIPVLVLAGAGLAGLGVHLHKQTELFLERAVRGTGVVVELSANHSSDGTTWAPVVEFEHEGRKHRFKDSISANPPSYRTGDTVAVLYDPFHPADARIDRGWWNKAIPILVGAFGALFCSLGLWMALRRTRTPIPKETAWTSIQ
jgi:hypothetical protein